jgi:hypothetical protein
MRWGSAVAVVLVAALAVATPAFADGDPASDYLLGQSVFAPYGKNVPVGDAGRLTQLVTDVRAQGFPIKVALIGSRPDLGAVTSLWLQPQRYAQFLSQELFYVHKGSLLIVMPNGYGIAKLGKPQPADRKILASVPNAGREIANLPQAAIGAVVALADARGIVATIPSASSAKSRNNHDRIVIIVAVAALLSAAIAVELVGRELRARKQKARREET